MIVVLLILYKTLAHHTNSIMFNLYSKNTRRKAEAEAEAEADADAEKKEPEDEDEDEDDYYYDSDTTVAIAGCESETEPELNPKAAQKAVQKEQKPKAAKKKQNFVGKKHKPCEPKKIAAGKRRRTSKGLFEPNHTHGSFVPIDGSVKQHVQSVSKPKKQAKVDLTKAKDDLTKAKEGITYIWIGPFKIAQLL